MVEAAAWVLGAPRGALRPGDRRASHWRKTFAGAPDLIGPDRASAAERLARVYESLLGDARAARRKRLGVHYTPQRLIDHVLAQTLDPALHSAVASAGASRGARRRALLRLRVLDPACGTGLFLLSAARRIGARLVQDAGVRAETALRAATLACVRGVDIDPHAARIARALLRLQAGLPIEGHDALNEAVRAGDALRMGPEGVRALTLGSADDALEGFDVVVGNPPFLSQLATATSRKHAIAARVAAWSGGAVKRYADAASAFMLLSSMAVRADGRVGLVQPRSFLTAADVRPVRTALVHACTLESLWVADGRVFDAGVYTCVLTLMRNAGSGSAIEIARFGEGFERGTPVRVAMSHLAERPSWGALAASEDVPSVLVTARAVLGDIATATADFRDAYYGLRGCVVDGPADADDPGLARVLTSGLIDLACVRWGARTTRLHGRAYSAPLARLDALRRDPTMAKWAAARLVPKVLLATQTRVQEVVVDDQGAWLPCTPVITVTARSAGPLRDESPLDRLWLIAAALASPVCCAIALREHAGSALNPDAIKLSAKQAMALPLPEDLPAWREGAACLRSAQAAPDDGAYARALAEFASRMGRAHGLPELERPRLAAWWRSRLAPRTRGRNGGAGSTTPAGTSPIMTPSRA